MKWAISRIAFLIISCTFFRCTNSPDLSGAPGSGQETTNGIVAAAVKLDGTPAACATVRLRHSDYVTAIPALAKAALYSADALTDSNGRFEIAGVDPGSYRIEVGDGQSAVLFACTLDVHDTVNLGVDTLRPYATIVGMTDTGGQATEQRYVQVAGLQRLVAVDASGRFALSDLPAGKFTVRAVTAHDTMISVALNVIVGSGESTDVTMLSGWRFSKRLYLNTTASGAGVTEDVTAFPLLVRLDAGNFDFTQVRDSGQDLRVTDSNGTLLAYEIEQWERGSNRAVIWVRMDTVRGGNATQYIRMHWGNPRAKSLSDGAAVFNPADGYMNVFHLGNDAQDATAHRSNGVVGDARDSSGAIAGGTYFDGIDDSIGFASTTGDTVVFSAWVFARSRGSSLFPNILQNPAFGVHFGFQDSSSNNHSVTFWTDSGAGNWKTLPGTIDTGVWYYITVIYDATSLTNAPVFYINGTPVTTIENLTPVSTGSFATGRGHIGNTVLNAPWDGCIDELRISRKIVTASWIKLSWENQRPGQRLVGP